jgi:hypothetical protein
MMTRLLSFLVASLALSGCFAINAGVPLSGRSRGPIAYPNGVATDSMEAEAMLAHYNATKCSLDVMRVRDRPDLLQVNAVQVDGCGSTRIYACVSDRAGRGGHYVAGYLCTDIERAAPAAPAPESQSTASADLSRR